jgi:hypothetical protein
MEPIVNLEEAPGKVVGKVRRRTPGEAIGWMVRPARALGWERLPYPKGLFRFRTFEEANEWQMQHQIAAAAANGLRDSQPKPT